METATRAQAGTRARQEADRLTAEGIRAVALTWVDNAGLTRAKAVPTARLAHAARHGVGVSPIFDVCLVDDSMTTSRHVGGPDGDLRLFPDLDRLAPLAAQPGWAWAPADRFAQSGAVHPVCQRRFARRMTELLRDAGFEALMAFETEWVVTTRSADGVPAPGAGEAAGAGSAASAVAGRPFPTHGPGYGMARLVEMSDYLGDVLEALCAQGVDVGQIHPEYAPGQFEVSVAPADPVGAADLAVLVRETVRAVSVAHDLVPSFGPVVTAGGVGNGRHLHLSIRHRATGGSGHRGGDRPYGMTGPGEAFLAGVLRELPALLAVGAPTPASYLRLQPSRWAGAYQCWGLENREAALRFVPGPPDEPDAANAEVKCFDPAANPYLVVGATLAAGLAGMAAGLSLPAPVAGDPAASADQLRLPGSLPEALARFEESTVLRAALGDPLFESVAAVRRAEAELFAGASAAELAAATRDRY